MYERLKGREDLTPIQHRVVILIHMRKKRERLLEMEALTYSAQTEAASKALSGVFERFQKLLIPGDIRSKAESFEDLAKKQLAKEVNTVYLVTPHGKGADETLKRAMKSNNPELRKWANWEQHKENVAKARMANKRRKKRTK